MVHTVVASLLLFGNVLRVSAANDFTSGRVQEVHVRGLGVPAVLREISREAHVTIGLEMDLIMGKESQIKLDFPGGTITELAKICTSLLQGASWRIVDGKSIVISQPGKASTLASVLINSSGTKNATRQQVWSDLSRKPEIKSWLRSEGCVDLSLLTGHEWIGDSAAISFPKGTMSVETLLSMAAREPLYRYAF